MLEAINTVGIMITTTGSEFVVRCGKTESMKKKDTVKNIM
jgi:S-adenosylhomocysteine hydrolase